MIGLLWIILVNCIYLPAIWYGVVNDDAMALKLNPYPLKRAKTFNVLLHTTIAGYIYLAFGQTHLALISAILFSVHPSCAQVAAWYCGRTYGISAVIFMMVLAFAPFSAPLFLFNDLSAITILLTPLAFLFTKHWYIALMFPLVVLLNYKRLKDTLNMKIKGDGVFVAALPKDFLLQKFEPRKIIIAVKTYGYYSLHCLLPIKNGFFNSFMRTFGTSKKETERCYSLNHHFLGGVIAIAITVTAWAFNIHNFIGFGILLYVFSIAPFLNFITVQQFTAPRYQYLPLIGFLTALVGLISKLPPLFQAALFGALFLFYLDRLIHVLRHYAKNDVTMMYYESEQYPDNPRIWYHRYEHMLNKKNPVMAWAEAVYGLKHLPEDCQLWFGLAVASYELGDYTASSEFLKTAERHMILTDRENMKGYIAEMRQRIDKQLQNKFMP